MQPSMTQWFRKSLWTKRFACSMTLNDHLHCQFGLIIESNHSVQPQAERCHASAKGRIIKSVNSLHGISSHSMAHLRSLANFDSKIFKNTNMPSLIYEAVSHQVLRICESLSLQKNAGICGIVIDVPHCNLGCLDPPTISPTQSPPHPSGRKGLPP